jgi:hypothetical protein
MYNKIVEQHNTELNVFFGLNEYNDIVTFMSNIINTITDNFLDNKDGRNKLTIHCDLENHEPSLDISAIEALKVELQNISGIMMDTYSSTI